MSLFPCYDDVKYLIHETLFNDPIIDCKFNTPPHTWRGLPKSKSLFHSPPDCGLPIGNLTSQLFSNVYLHDFDEFVKRKLKVKYYGRYVDDFYILSSETDPQYYKYLRREMDNFLKENLELNLHPRKFYQQHYSKGIPFLGVVVYPYYTTIGRRVRNAYHVAPPENKHHYKGFFMHHNTHALMNKE